MTVAYPYLGNLLLWGKGVGRRNFFQLTQEEYRVTRQEYVKSLMYHPFLSELLGRDLKELNEFLEGKTSAHISRWMREDISLSLLNMKKGLICGIGPELASRVVFLIEDEEPEEMFARLDTAKKLILDTARGDRKPEGEFFLHAGIPLLLRVREDPSILDDGLLANSFVCMEVI